MLIKGSNKVLEFWEAGRLARANYFIFQPVQKAFVEMPAQGLVIPASPEGKTIEVDGVYSSLGQIVIDKVL